MEAQVSLNEDTLVLTGCLDERFPFSRMVAAVNGRGNPMAQLSLDLSEVRRANSVGVAEFLINLRKFKCQLVFEKAPVWLVEQFGLVDEFFAPNVTIKSFFAPVFSPKEDVEKTILLVVGKDVPILETYAGYQFSYVDEEGREMQPEFYEEEYLRFLSHLIGRATPGG